MAALTRRKFAVLLMDALDIPDTLAHVGTRRFLAGTWPHAETGERPGLCNGVPGEGARWNPFNTTLPLAGSTFYNHLSPTTGVQNYRTAADGALAFKHTLLGDARYAAFVHALSKPGMTQRQLCIELDATPWGTHLALLEAARKAYNANRSFYNNYPIGA